MTRSEHAARTSTADPTVANQSSPTAAPASIRAEVAGRTDVGRVRKRNEDSMLVAELAGGRCDPIASYDVRAAGLVLAVCDGMGGAPAGALASQLAVDTLCDKLRCSATSESDSRARELVAAVSDANSRIAESSRLARERRGMGTTATVATVEGDLLLVAQIGDSRAYVLRAGVLTQVTSDQTLVNLQREAGIVRKDQGKTRKHANLILQALGTHAEVWVDLTFLTLRRGDRLLICSDGLTGPLTNDVIRDLMLISSDPNTCSERLIRAANAAGGRDNITVIVCDLDGEGLRSPEPSDLVRYEQYPGPAPSDGDGAGTGILHPIASGYRALRPHPYPAFLRGQPRILAAARPLGQRASQMLLGLLALALAGVASYLTMP